MNEKINQIKIGEKIRYSPVHKSYGRAEFVFCPVFKRGKMTELHIYRKQQNKKEHFLLDVTKELPEWRVNTFTITSWTHKTEHPKIWRNFWCKEHKTISFEVYVPDNTNTIEFDCYFGTDISIRFVMI